MFTHFTLLPLWRDCSEALLSVFLISLSLTFSAPYCDVLFSEAPRNVLFGRGHHRGGETIVILYKRSNQPYSSIDIKDLESAF